MPLPFVMIIMYHVMMRSMVAFTTPHSYIESTSEEEVDDEAQGREPETQGPLAGID